jgi:FkbM family methyltransferase
MTNRHFHVRTFRQRTKRVIEKLTGIEIEHLGGKAFFLIDASTRAQAWYSYRATLRSILEKCAVNHVVDVGANTGQFGQNLRAIYSGKISSFEPVSSTFQRLAATAAADENWIAYQFALGSKAGTETIHVSTMSEFSSFLKTNDYCATRFGEEAIVTREESITIRRLDDVLEETAPKNEIQKIYLKLDTQGYDIEVFEGLGDRLKDVVALQSEMSLIPIYENMPHWTDCIRMYEKAGFNVVGMYPVTRDCGRVIEYDCILTRV